MDQTTVENQKLLLVATLQDRIMKGKNTIIFKELMDEQLPQFLKNYLTNRVQKIYNTEEPFQTKNSKRYDLNYHRIEELRLEFKRAFEEATLFTKEEMEEIISRTISLQWDLLTSPAVTLKKIFFQHRTELTQTEVLRILEALDDERIFIKNLIKNIRHYDQYHILSDDFSLIVVSTMEESYSRDFSDTLLSDLQALLNFFNCVDASHSNQLHKNIVKLMLEKRNLEHLYDMIITTDDSCDVYELSVLGSRLSELNLFGSENEYLNHGREDHSKDSISFHTDDKAYALSSETPDATGLPGEAQLHQFQEKSDTHHPIIMDCKDPQDFIIDRSMIEHQPDIPLVSLNSLFDDKSKRMIQKKIFNKDNEAYNKFLDRLESIDNWKEAKQIIDYELMIRSIQPFSREALKLGDLVFNRYFPQKK
ncbi:hypothetical protein JXB12_06055 [candidate division KSB1 bacterium]|nr:hypothetical protein [candidate division KSB1 bacterium]